MSTTAHTESEARRAAPQAEPGESRGERLRRHGHRTWLYAWAFGLVALLVILVAFVIANTGQVRVSWVVDSGRASLVWIVLGSAVLGWLLGIVTSVVFRLRTRRRTTARRAAPELADRAAGSEAR
jgi:uncharacterized integral membrane protein